MLKLLMSLLSVILISMADYEYQEEVQEPILNCVSIYGDDLKPYNENDGPCEVMYGDICYDEDEKDPWIMHARYVEDDEEEGCDGTEICED